VAKFVEEGLDVRVAQQARPRAPAADGKLHTSATACTRQQQGGARDGSDDNCCNAAMGDLPNSTKVVALAKGGGERVESRDAQRHSERQCHTGPAAPLRRRGEEGLRRQRLTGVWGRGSASSSDKGVSSLAPSFVGCPRPAPAAQREMAACPNLPARGVQVQVHLPHHFLSSGKRKERAQCHKKQ